MSDTHLGLTPYPKIMQMLIKAKRQEFDLIVHCGDYSGGRYGYRKVEKTLRAIRSVFPECPVVSVLGNHDYWARWNGREGLEYVKHRIQESMDTFDIHFLDREHIYSHPDFDNILIAGHTGWYYNPVPPTNDILHLPSYIDGDTHRHFRLEAYTESIETLDLIQEHGDGKTLVWVSHFPVLREVEDQFELSAFDKFSGNPKLGDMLFEEYNCRYFLEGHSHRYENGPYKYNSGSDYGTPRFQVIDIQSTLDNKFYKKEME